MPPFTLLLSPDRFYSLTLKQGASKKTRLISFDPCFPALFFFFASPSCKDGFGLSAVRYELRAYDDALTHAYHNHRHTCSKTAHARP